MDLQQLGQLLSERRQNTPIKVISKQYHLSPQTYRLIERGLRRPQIRTCYRLAGFLNVRPEFILELAGYPPAKSYKSPE